MSVASLQMIPTEAMGLVPAIHVFLPARLNKGVDGRPKAGHDSGKGERAALRGKGAP